MSGAGTSSSVVSERYANALIELADEAKKLDKVEKDLKDLAGMIASSEDLAQTIRSPMNNQATLHNAMQAPHPVHFS